MGCTPSYENEWENRIQKLQNAKNNFAKRHDAIHKKLIADQKSFELEKWYYDEFPRIQTARYKVVVINELKHKVNPGIEDIIHICQLVAFADLMMRKHVFIANALIVINIRIIKFNSNRI